MSILDKIYDWYVLDNPKVPGDEGVRDEFCDQWEKADQILNKELAEKLQTSLYAYMEEESRHDFQAGFRLGALLMLELHIPAAPVSAAPEGLRSLQ